MKTRTSSAALRANPIPERDRFPMDRHVFYLLTQIINRRNRSLGERLAAEGLSVAKWRVLGCAYFFPGCVMTELAEYTAVDRTTLTRTVDQLVESGLVERRNPPRNRRLVSLHLTTPGEATLEAIMPLVLEQNGRALRGVTPQDFEALLRILKQINANLADTD
jgi:DNA-binding MarR family transcriptional regulator